MTESAIGRLFLSFSSNKLQQLSARVDNCLARLSDEQVWARGDENENAAGNRCRTFAVTCTSVPAAATPIMDRLITRTVEKHPRSTCASI